MARIKDSTFVISSNGYADGPAQALRDFLLIKKAKLVVMVNHPLVSETAGLHRISTYASGSLVKERNRNLQNKPPLTYIFDLIVPLKLPTADVWFGFNNLAAKRGLSRRRKGKADKVVYWAVDFVPDRFGHSPLTKVYKQLDKFVSQNVDYRVELSEVGVDGRNKYLGLKPKNIAPTTVVPMGAWLDRTPKTNNESWQKHRLVFLAHLVPRQGGKELIEALAIINNSGKNARLDVIGGGPEADKLKVLADKLGQTENIIFHGFVEDHADVEKILAGATLAVAPYRKESNFVQFTDSGKLKAYLGAGLPVVLTDLPNNAHELQKAGCAFIADDSIRGLADKIEEVLFDETKWLRARRAAEKKAQEFDWNTQLSSALKKFGFS